LENASLVVLKRQNIARDARGRENKKMLLAFRCSEKKRRRYDDFEKRRVHGITKQKHHDMRKKT
jgi:hypothetical protein